MATVISGEESAKMRQKRTAVIAAAKILSGLRRNFVALKYPPAKPIATAATAIKYVISFPTG